MKNLTVAVVGCGYVANGHLAAWKKVRCAKVVAVSDLDVRLAEATARQWGIKQYFTSFSSMVGQNQVDIVDICTPPQTHASLAIEAMDTDANVLIEKPMTATVEDAEAIVQYQKHLTASLNVGVIHNWLFEREILRASSLVRDGCLGGILSVEVEAINTKYDSMASKKNHWCHSFAGGRFSEMLAHPVYLLMHFLGPIRVAAVQITKYDTYPWMKSDELCVLFKSGRSMGRTYASFNAPREAIFVNIYGTEAILKVDVINAVSTLLPKRQTNRFTKGYDSLKQARNLTTSTAGNVGRVLSGRWMSGHDTYIRIFAESVLEGSKPPVTAEEGLAVVKVVTETCRHIDQAEREDVCERSGSN